jgi:remodeling and spacing factor 1
MFASKMASASQTSCLTDPNYAVICSFLDQFGELLGLPDLTFKDVQNYLEDTRNCKRVFRQIAPK